MANANCIAEIDITPDKKQTRENLSFTELPSYKKLEEHFKHIRRLHMRRLFSIDEKRFDKFSIQFEDTILDYSKNRITDKTKPLLCSLAREARLEEWRDRMFSGDNINSTEDRAVLHTALRNHSTKPVIVDGKDVMPEIKACINKMRIFSSKVRDGKWKGHTRKAITDIVNIGIGGSDAGPKMVYEALKPYRHKRLNVHFISNVDAAHLQGVLDKLNPETTLFIISSRTFSTQETLSNANLARDWIMQSARDERAMRQHFVAVSSNMAAVQQFGIDPDNVFEYWDWVGGRYSLWSSIGLPIALAIGMGQFRKVLDGAHAMDNHFKEAPLEQNMPVIMGMLGIWYNNFFKSESHGIFPYDHCLRSLPMYLEKADMESNGKSVDRNGRKVNYPTGSIIWGASGISSQHALYQSLHQGTKLIPADFIVSMQSQDSQYQPQHEILFANALAQSEALMRGQNLDETYKKMHQDADGVIDISDRIHHMVVDGNHPSNMILLKKVNPRSLGSLIALYEHKIFVQGILWNLNSFDQWGVELGKQLSRRIINDVHQPYPVVSHDASTNALINIYRQHAARNLDDKMSTDKQQKT